MTAMIVDANDAALLVEAILVTAAVIALGGTSLYMYAQSRHRSQDTYTMLSDRVNELEKERQADYSLLRSLQVRVTELELGVRVLIAQIVRGGGVPEWTPEQATEIAPPRPLHEAIGFHFNNEEIDDLAARVGIDPEALAGHTRMKRAQSLVEAASRNGLTDVLIATAKELRPKGNI